MVSSSPRTPEDDQSAVAALLASMPPVEVPASFLAGVNARIDAPGGWIGLADFRLWTLRLAPIAAALVLVAILWPAAGATPPRSETVAIAQPSTAAAFSPSSARDWQRDVSPDALLDAALHPSSGDARAR